MNIGLDFNSKTTKAAFLVDSSNAEDCKVIEIKNILVFVSSDIFAGDEGFNKYLTEKDSQIFDLDQIIEWNGLIFNKKQISVEKCLSIMFAYLLKKIKTHAFNDEINFICVSIPYDKYYYWHVLIKKAFSLIGIERLSIISQPTAFFGQPNIKYLHSRLNKERLRAVKKYEGLIWYKKLISRKPEYRGENGYTGNLFVSISQDNMNVSLVDYGEGVLQIISTQYTNVITRRKIENFVLNYFVSEIDKDSQNFALKDKKTLLRILEKVNDFLRAPLAGNTFELNLPYVLCEDGEYRTLNTKIDLNTLNNSLASTFNSLVETVIQLATATHEAQKEERRNQYRVKIENVIVVGDSFIQQNINELLIKAFDNAKIAFGNEKLLAIGAFDFSRVRTGEKMNFVALEVIPFSILVRLSSGEFVEMIKRDSTIPIDGEHNFVIKGESKSKFVEIQLTTKEGNLFQSLNIWKIEATNVKIIKITVEIGSDLNINLVAHSDNGQKLLVHKGRTFSFSGAGFEVGIKGKDIRQYILNQFNYLNTVLDDKEITIFEPDEIFYSMLRDGNPFKALRYLGHFLKLKSLPDVEMSESQFFEEQGIDGFISGSKISIPKSLLKDLHGFGYVLAHELAHYILIKEEQIILDDEQENEILTEIFVIYSGMGKLFLNGFKSKSSHYTHGYLNEKVIKYIHQIYFQKFSVNLSTYKKNLTKEAVKILDEFID